MAKENLPHHCKTFLAAISHFPQAPPSVLPAYCNRNRPPSCPEFRRGTPLIRVPHTFGLFPVPGAVLPFFMFMWQKVPNPIRVARQPSARSCYSTFFPGRKFKMFTYLTNIHYHATYSKLLCLNIRNL